MSEQPLENTETPVEAPAEPAQRPDWDSELESLQRAYDSESAPEGAQESVDGRAPLEDWEKSGREDWAAAQEGEQASAPNLSSADWRDLSDRFNSMSDYILHAEEERLIEAALKRIKGDADLTIDDKMLRELATGHFQANPNALALWRNQRNDPGSLDRYLSRYGGEIQRQFGKRELTETSDIEAIEASVRGSAEIADGRRTHPKLPTNPTREQIAVWRDSVLNGR